VAAGFDCGGSSLYYTVEVDNNQYFRAPVFAANTTALTIDWTSPLVGAFSWRVTAWQGPYYRRSVVGGFCLLDTLPTTALAPNGARAWPDQPFFAFDFAQGRTTCGLATNVNVSIVGQALLQFPPGLSSYLGPVLAPGPNSFTAALARPPTSVPSTPFWVGPPLAVALVAPADTASVTNPVTLAWAASSQGLPTSYNVLYSLDGSSFQAIAQTNQTSVSATLVADGWWTVAPLNQIGVGPTAPARRLTLCNFNRSTLANLGATPRQPFDSQTVSPNPTFDWTRPYKTDDCVTDQTVLAIRNATGLVHQTTVVGAGTYTLSSLTLADGAYTYTLLFQVIAGGTTYSGQLSAVTTFVVDLAQGCVAINPQCSSGDCVTSTNFCCAQPLYPNVQACRTTSTCTPTVSENPVTFRWTPSGYSGCTAPPQQLLKIWEGTDTDIAAGVLLAVSLPADAASYTFTMPPNSTNTICIGCQANFAWAVATDTGSPLIRNYGYFRLCVPSVPTAPTGLTTRNATNPITSFPVSLTWTPASFGTTCSATQLVTLPTGLVDVGVTATSYSLSQPLASGLYNFSVTSKDGQQAATAVSELLVCIPAITLVSPRPSTGCLDSPTTVALRYYVDLAPACQSLITYGPLAGTSPTSLTSVASQANVANSITINGAILQPGSSYYLSVAGTVAGQQFIATPVLVRICPAPVVETPTPTPFPLLPQPEFSWTNSSCSQSQSCARLALIDCCAPPSSLCVVDGPCCRSTGVCTTLNSSSCPLNECVVVAPATLPVTTAFTPTPTPSALSLTPSSTDATGGVASTQTPGTGPIPTPGPVPAPVPQPSSNAPTDTAEPSSTDVTAPESPFPLAAVAGGAAGGAVVLGVVIFLIVFFVCCKGKSKSTDDGWDAEVLGQGTEMQSSGRFGDQF
jgi:hypothetical protein